jgi:ectoine hydroxylase-related dioxygenase (phytanoyl-CoA dioxygenase family)
MYKEDGYLVIKDFLDQRIAQEISNSLKDITLTDKKVFSGRLDKEIFLIWNNILDGKSKKISIDFMPQIKNNILTKKTIDFLKAQADTEFLQLFETIFFVKPAFIGQGFPLHNDNCFFPLYPAEHLSLWVAISESTLENGCLKIRKGSHKDKIVTDLDIKGNADSAWQQKIALDNARKFELIEIPANPGDAIIFDGYCFHESGPNTTSEDRIAISMRFLKQPSSLVRSRSAYQGAEFVRQIEFCDYKMRSDVFPIF